MRSWLLIFAAVALAGCEPSPSASEPPRVDWQMLDDGSYFYLRAPDNYNVEGSRCWPGQGGFDCITVAAHLGTYMGYEITRTRRPELKGPSSAVHNGYVCDTSVSSSFYDEAIERTGSGKATDGKLATNFVFRHYGVPPKPWSEKFVTNFLRENGLPAGSYFKCGRLAEILLEGSTASLGTSLVKKEDIL